MQLAVRHPLTFVSAALLELFRKTSAFSCSFSQLMHHTANNIISFAVGGVREFIGSRVNQGHVVFSAYYT